MSLYEQAGIQERIAIEKFASSFFNPRLLVEIEFTPANGFDCYDGRLDVTDPDTLEHTVLIVEVKIRGKHYPTLMIEQQKFESLMDKTNSVGENAFAVYLNSTPNGTYAFDLKQLKEDGKLDNWQDKELIYHTCTPSDGNKIKSVGYIQIKDAFFSGLYN